MASMGNTPAPTSLRPNRPQQRIADDKLGREGFARSLWLALRNHDAEEAIVIGLQAPWGDGKTTLLNMVQDLEATEAKNDAQAERILFVHFNPWEWAAQNQVANAFFRELANQIDAASGARIEKAAKQALAKLLRELPKILGLAEVATKGFTFAAAPFNSLLAAWLGTATLTFSKLKDLFHDVQKHATKPEPQETKPIEEIKGEVRAQFAQFKKATGRNIVCCIDDMDRLSGDELRQVLQLVKINADFPGLIFVLLFDKHYVERQLRRQFGRDAAAFLEKIVQVEMMLPKASEKHLYQCLLNDVSAILEKRPIYHRVYEETRLRESFDAWFRHHLTNPRGYGRLLSSWSFRLDAFQSRAAEVNPVDLLVLEGLSLYEPKVYEQLSKSMDLIFPDADIEIFESLSRRDSASPTGPSKRMQCLNRLAQMGQTNDARPVKEALKFLLGVSGDDFEPLSEQEEELRRRHLRFSDPLLFRRYFRLTIDTGDVSSADIQVLLENMSAPMAFFAHLTKLEADGIVLDALDHLKAARSEPPRDPTVFLSHMLIWWEARLTSLQTPGIREDLKRPLMDIYRWVVGDRSGSKRLSVALDAIEASKAVFAATYIANHESLALHRRRNILPNDLSGVLGPEDDERLRDAVAYRVHDWFAKSHPDATPHEIEACYWMWGFGGLGRAAFVRLLLSSPSGTLTLLLGTVGRWGFIEGVSEAQDLPGMVDKIIPYGEFREGVRGMEAELRRIAPERIPDILRCLDAANNAIGRVEPRP